MRPLFALLLTLLPTPAPAQDVTAKLTTDRTDPKVPLRLSESFTATLSFEGPAPLRVELPAQSLDRVTDNDWKIQPLGTPNVAVLAGKRERWSQSFRLSPYVTGESLQVNFAPVRVNGREIQVDRFEVRVVSTVADSKADPRPVTGIEPVPDSPPVPAAPTPAWVWAAICVLLAAVAVAVAWAFRRRPPPPPPAERARAAFDRLERSRVSGAELVERGAAILRAFIDSHLGIPATRLTTPELLAAAEQAGRPVEETDALRGILDRCDRAKFAGDVPDDDGCRDLVARCRQWVDDVSPAGAGPR